MLIDKVPRRFRPVIGVIGAIIILYEADPNAQKVLGSLMSFIPITALFIALLILARNIFKRKPNEAKACEGFEIEVPENGEEKEKFRKLIPQLIKERSRAGGKKYGVFSISSNGYTRSFILVGNASNEEAKIEAEVIKTVVSTSMGKVKIKALSENDKEALSCVLRNISPVGNSDILAIESGKGLLPEGGEIYMGKTYEGAYQKDVYIGVKDIQGHVSIFGSTGNGKSTTAASIAYRSSKYFDVIILDWTGEYESVFQGMSNVIPSKEASIDPFKLPEFRQRQDILIDSLSLSLGLTPPQEYLLEKVIEEYKPTSIHNLVESIESYAGTDAWGREVKRGLLRKVNALKKSIPKEARPLNIGPGINIVRLSEIENISSRRAFALLLLALLYLREKSRNLLVIIDEAQNLFQGEAKFLEQVFAESRKYGMSIVVSTQSPALIPNSILLNSNTKIVHSLKSARDKEIISLSMNLKKEIISQLDKLEPGEALLQSPSISNPIILRIEPAKHFRS
ncbi:MAG: ATP-binding protein [Caldisphaeraceae archaeon]|nr:ATP-binding protein [Caldisphaeraceae archaeon]MEB3691780.1 ATP-binding protein [Caldisphaeraceae archaeon]MEB3798576.1 ATP-binding protein [Caldisphaeraceae archaeon]